MHTEQREKYKAFKQLELTRAHTPVDSISMDGPDIHIYVIHYKKAKKSEQVNF